MHTRKFLGSCLVLVIVSSCSVVPTESPQDTEQPRTQNPAVKNLLWQVEQNKSYGEYELAKAKLERALRIEPNNAHLWFELAQINYKEHAYREAKNLARRALSYTQGNRALKNEIRNFIDAIVAM